jgi:uncharacterized protein (DUF433 family)
MIFFELRRDDVQISLVSLARLGGKTIARGTQIRVRLALSNIKHQTSDGATPINSHIVR